MKKLCLLLCFLPLAYAAHVTILRDEYGVPHIFAQDAAGAAFGSGYAQAEDRLEEMLKNYRRAEGTLAPACLASPAGGRAALQRAPPAQPRNHRGAPRRPVPSRIIVPGSGVVPPK